MVHYRQHSLSMTNTLNELDPRICTRDDLAVLWRLMRKAEEARQWMLVKKIDKAIAERSVYFLTVQTVRASRPWFTNGDFEDVVGRNARGWVEGREIRGTVYCGVADHSFWLRDFDAALTFYRRSLRQNPCDLRVWAKYGLLRIGGSGIRVREWWRSFKHPRIPLQT
jgi:hypothetical protein